MIYMFLLCFVCTFLAYCFVSVVMVFKTHFSSSSFNVVSFSLLELDVIWVASTIFHSLPYLPWCSTFSCLLPLPYCRSSLGYLWALYLPPPAPLLSYVCYSHPYVLHDQTISTTPHPLLTSSLVILSCYLTLDMYLCCRFYCWASSPVATVYIHLA